MKEFAVERWNEMNRNEVKEMKMKWKNECRIHAFPSCHARHTLLPHTPHLEWLRVNQSFIFVCFVWLLLVAFCGLAIEVKLQMKRCETAHLTHLQLKWVEHSRPQQQSQKITHQCRVTDGWPQKIIVTSPSRLPFSNVQQQMHHIFIILSYCFHWHPYKIKLNQSASQINGNSVFQHFTFCCLISFLHYNTSTRANKRKQTIC